MATELKAATPADDTPIVEIALPTRIRNAALSGGLVTVGQLRAISDEHLLSVSNVGHKSVSDMRKLIGYRNGACGHLSAERDPDERIAELLASNNALLERARRAERLKLFIYRYGDNCGEPRTLAVAAPDREAAVNRISDMTTYWRPGAELEERPITDGLVLDV